MDCGILWTKVFYYNSFRWVPDEDIREWTWDDEYELYKLKADTIFYDNDAGEICKLLKGTEVTVVKGREIPDFSTDLGFISVVESLYDNTHGWIDKRDLGEKVSEGSGESHYNITLEDALDKQMKQKPQVQSNGKWVNASRDEVLVYLNPSNYNSGNDKY